jgi:uncharacterized protein
MLFEWDENKRKKTLLERGIDFVDAALVWADPARQERVDHRVNYGEVRVQTIGKVKFGILLVVYTQRVNEGGQDVNRIISVRKSSKKEREEYEKRTFRMGRVV